VMVVRQRGFQFVFFQKTSLEYTSDYLNLLVIISICSERNPERLCFFCHDVI